jgi:hypothetical protein
MRMRCTSQQFIYLLKRNGSDIRFGKDDRSEVNRLVNRVIEDVESFAKSQPQTEKLAGGKEIAIAI